MRVVAGLLVLVLALALALVSAPGTPAGAVESAAPPAPEAPEFETGKVVARVVTRHDPEQSYALYLPKGYTPERRWPILYGFSPAARGTDPVQLFRSAAERYGWIVVGSNNSRNGPREPIEAAIKAVLKDTEARLAIDPARRYSTGFSGGARVGFRLAAVEGFAGTIPIGAGMSPDQKAPARDGPAVFAMCGVDDFNHGELLRLEDGLAAAGVPARMATFPGGHGWATPELAAAAVRYMELRWLAGRGKRDEPRIAELVKAEAADALKLLDSPGQLLRAHRHLAELAALAGSDELRARLAEVEAGGKYQAEQALAEELAKLGAELNAIENREERLDRSLERYAAFARKHPGSEAAARLAVLLRSTAMSMAMGAAQLMEARRYPDAERLLLRARKLAPADRTLAYNLACVLARNGRKDEAVRMLAEAVRLGFRDFEHIRKDPDLETLRSDPEFRKIVGLPEEPAAEGGTGKPAE